MNRQSAAAVRDLEITQNVRGHAPLGLARAVFARLMSRRPTGVGLQEWTNGRNRLLRELPGHRLCRLPRTHRAIRKLRRRAWQPREGFTWYRPLLGPTGPVGRDASRYELRYGRAVTATWRRRVQPTAKHRRRWPPPNRFTVAVWYDHLLDEVVTDIGYHLWAGVQRHGRYSTLPEDRRRVQGHQQQVQALQRLIAEHLAKGRTVYARGDSNYHGLVLAGVTSAWASNEHLAVGTHGRGGRKIDDVHGPGLALVDVIDHPEHQIDHAGVVAVRHRMNGRPR